MDPEITTQAQTGNKRSYSLIALLVVLVIVGAVIIFLPRGNTSEQNGEVKNSAVVKKVYTQAEKEQILAQLAASLPKDTTSQIEKERLLRALAKKIPVDTTSPEEKLRLLTALTASAGQ